MAASSRIGIVLLAAGNSSRMGGLKQLLPYRGTTLLRHAVRTAMETEFAPVVVVLGAEAESCRAEFADLPAHSVVNSDWAQGMGTSVQTGIRELARLAPDLEAALIMLHDQPMITAPKLRELVGKWTSVSCAVASDYDGKLGVPALFARELFDELSMLEGNQGARPVLERHRPRVIPFTLPEARQDIDTPGDYERLG